MQLRRLLASRFVSPALWRSPLFLSASSDRVVSNGHCRLIIPTRGRGRVRLRKRAGRQGGYRRESDNAFSYAQQWPARIRPWPQDLRRVPHAAERRRRPGWLDGPPMRAALARRVGKVPLALLHPTVLLQPRHDRALDVADAFRARAAAVSLVVSLLLRPAHAALLRLHPVCLRPRLAHALARPTSLRGRASCVLPPSPAPALLPDVPSRPVLTFAHLRNAIRSPTTNPVGSSPRAPARGATVPARQHQRGPDGRHCTVR